MNRKMTPLPCLARLALGALAVTAVACGAEGTGSNQPRKLADVAVPPGFDFATTRATTLEVTRAADGMRVETSSGRVLYRGPKLTTVTFAVPAAEEALKVVLQTGAAEEAHFAKIEDGRARL